MKEFFAGTSLCVVGNVNRDVKLAAIEPGERLFRDGETPTAEIRETIGGGGANSAAAAAALGARVTFIGKVGDDALGDRLARTLASRGVEPRLVRDPAVSTGTSVNLVWTTGHRHFVSCLPNATSLHFDEIDLDALRGHEHLLRADAWFSEPMLLGGGNRRLFQAGKDAGIKVSLDVNYDPFAPRLDPAAAARRRDALRDLLPLVDLVHANSRELAQLGDAEHLGAGAYVLHMGADGAGLLRGGQLVREPAAPLDRRVVNTTGTGDVLSVCMMLLHQRPDMPVQDKLRIANQVVADYMTGRLDLVPRLVD